MRKVLKFKWGVSRGKDSYGYNICSLYVDGKKVASTCGGGYDMKGTVLGHYIAKYFKDELLKLTIPMNRRNGVDIQEYYGLSFYDPNWDPGSYVPETAPAFGKDEDVGKTVKQLEAEGKSLGLERYQAFYAGSSKTPSARHTVPLIDGACGFSSVEMIVNGMNLTLEYVDGETYILKA